MARSCVRAGRVLRLAERVLSLPTVPYREGAVIAEVQAFVRSRPHLELRADRFWNLELRRRAVRPSRRPLVLCAHMDHPGFHAVRTRGRPGRWRLEARFLGGVRRECFAGARVRFFSPEREVRGRVLRARPEPGTGELRVTLAVPEAIAPGAFGMWDLPPFRRSAHDPDRLETRAADDLAGLASVLALLDAIEAIDPARKVDVRGLFTRAEEVGFVGALAVARGRLLPRTARLLAIEASQALPHAPQGAGPILRVGDRTSLFDDRLTRWIAQVGSELARERRGGFAWQRRLMDGGTCESTAYQLYGYPCAALCLPLGNYHNMTPSGRIGPESIRLSDLVGLVRFFEALVRRDREAPRRPGLDPLRTQLERRFRRARRELGQSPFAPAPDRRPARCPA